MNLKINKENERIDMCQAWKEIIKDAIKEEKEKTKAEKAKNKAAMLKIKELRR